MSNKPTVVKTALKREKNVSIETNTRRVVRQPFFFLERKKNKMYNATIITAIIIAPGKAC